MTKQDKEFQVATVETYQLRITEADYEGDQFLTLGHADFDSEDECVAAYMQTPGSDESDPTARREYKLDRLVGGGRVDEKFIAPALAQKLLGADLTHLHDQAEAALSAEINFHFPAQT